MYVLVYGKAKDKTGISLYVNFKECSVERLVVW